MIAYIEIGLTEYLVEWNYKITAKACPEQGPSYASGGEPASPMEWEVSGPIRLYFESPGKPTIQFEVPTWLDEEISAYIQEDSRGIYGPAVEEDAINDDYYND